MKIKILLFSSIVLFQCQQNNHQSTMSNSEMLQLVKSLDDQFGVAIKKRDSAMLANIYSESSRYVQPNREILVGKTEIGKDWGGFLRMKENPVNIIFEINNVGGNREVIYETGTGYTLLADSTHWNFNYVNVWALQKDGTYKLEVDTYTPMDK